MADLGGFTLAHELCRTPFGSVYAARREGDRDESPAAFAARICRPDPVMVGQAEAAAVVEAFLASAAALRDAAGPAMVAVHGIGRLDPTPEAPAGAFVVTDLALRGSCERLVVGASAVDARSLASIVHQIADALAGLKARRGRGHGRIEPRHVLLIDDQPLASVRIALTDPLPDPQAAGEEAFVADLRALGELIHALVVRRAYSGSWPVVDSPAWQRLGRTTGSAWRDLCNRLLAPPGEDPRAPITLDDLTRHIPSPAAGGRGTRRRGMAIVAVAAVLIGATVAWRVLTPGQPPPTFAMIGADAKVGDEAAQRWRAVVEAYYPRQGWLDPFVQALAPDRKIRESEAEGIAELRTWCPDLLEGARPLADPAAKPPAIAGRADEAAVFWEEPAPGSLRELGELLRDPGSRSLEKYRYLGDAAITRTREVSGAMERFRAAMNAEWEPLASAEAAGRRFAERGWSNGAAEIDAHVAALRTALAPGSERDAGAESGGPGQGRDLAALAVNVAKSAATASAIENDFAELQSLAGSIRTAEDPWLGRLTSALSALVAEQAAEDEPLATLRRGVEEARRVVAEVAAMAGPERRPPVDRPELLRLIGQRGLGATAISRASLRSWIELAAAAVVAGEHPAGALRTSADAAAGLVRDYGATPSSLSGRSGEFEKELAALRTEIDALAGRSYVAGTRAEVDRLAEASRARIAALTERARAETAAALERERRALEALRSELLSDPAWADITRSTAVNDHWRRRRDAMLDRPGQTAAGLDAERQRMRELLTGLDRAVTPAPAAAPADGAWGERLAQAAAGARDRALASALAALGDGDLAEPERDHAAHAADAACKAWLARAQDLKADLSRVASTLSIKFSLSVAAGDDGRTAQAIWAQWQADAFIKEPAVAAALEPLAVRVEAHRAVAAEGDPQRLLAVIRDSPAEQADVAIAAFTRLTAATALGGLGWPRRGDDLIPAAAAAADVRALAAQPGPEPVLAAAASARVEADASACWTGFARRVIDGGGEDAGSPAERAAAFRAAISAMGDFGLTAADVTDPAIRANLLLAAFAGSLEGASDDTVRPLAASLRQAIEGLSLDDPRLAPLVSDLRARIETPPRVTPVEQLGPGGKGFAARGRFENGRVTFIIADGHDVTFVAIDRPEGTVFMAEHEASLDLFRALAEKAGMGSAEIVNAGWLGDRPERAEKPDEEWTGPRVWRWARASGGYRLSAGSSWYDTRSNPLQKFQAEPAYPDVVRDPQKRPDPSVVKLPSGMGDEPSPAMPMQRVTPRGAAAACEAMGCRLPTESEWRAALAAMPRREPGAGFNLRDQAFKRLEDHIRPLRDGGTVSLDFHRLPDEGAHDYRDDHVGATHPFSDGFVWFWPVAAGPTDQPLRNLIGNVAEVVTTDARDGFAAIGGSALSRIENPIDRPVPIDESSSYWDVGFRPAFSSKDRVPDPLRVQARRILTERLGETMLLMKP